MSEEQLLANDVEPFTEMPLWLPEEPGNRACLLHVERPRPAQGLELRHLADTARDTWEWMRAVRAGELPEPIAGGFVARGLSAEREAALLGETISR